MTPPITAMTIIAPPNSTAVVQGRFPGGHGFKRGVRFASSGLRADGAGGLGLARVSAP
jgi:hypothetical protein